MTAAVLIFAASVGFVIYVLALYPCCFRSGRRRGQDRYEGQPSARAFQS